jgi:hypothetical protein
VYLVVELEEFESVDGCRIAQGSMHVEVLQDRELDLPAIGAKGVCLE